MKRRIRELATTRYLPFAPLASTLPSEARRELGGRNDAQATLDELQDLQQWEEVAQEARVEENEYVLDKNSAVIRFRRHWAGDDRRLSFHEGVDVASKKLQRMTTWTFLRLRRKTREAREEKKISLSSQYEDM